MSTLRVAQRSLASATHTGGDGSLGTWLPLRRVYILVAGSLFAFAALIRPVAPNDLWFHLALGRTIVSTGTIPLVDTFSYTQGGAPFFNQAWLAQVVLYGVHRLGGIPAVLVAHAVVLVVAYGFVLWLCLRRSGRTQVAVFVTLSVTLPASAANWMVRPQVLALALFAAFFFIVERYRLGFQDEHQTATARLWVLPVVMTLWVNVHGSFPLGGVLLALILAGEAAKRGILHQPSLTWPAWWRLAAWTCVTAVAVLVNPRGAEVLHYVTNLMTAPAVRELITEWAPPTIADMAGAPFFVAAVAVFVVAMYAKRSPDLTDVLVVVTFFALGLTATRNGVWFVIVAAPFTAERASTLLRKDDADPGSPLINVAISAVMVGLVVAVLPWVKPHVIPEPTGSLLAEDTPVAAVEALRADRTPPRRLVNGLAAGSYLMWALPSQPVFMDPRIELYPMEQISDYFSLRQGRDIERLVGRYDVDGALLSRSEEGPLIRELKKDRDWITVHEDDHFAYLKRRP